jgi:hypothetical protein
MSVIKRASPHRRKQDSLIVLYCLGVVKVATLHREICVSRWDPKSCFVESLIIKEPDASLFGFLLLYNTQNNNINIIISCWPHYDIDSVKVKVTCTFHINYQDISSGWRWCVPGPRWPRDARITFSFRWPLIYAEVQGGGRVIVARAASSTLFPRITWLLKSTTLTPLGRIC